MDTKKITYLGIDGSYSHLAALEYFKDDDINLIGVKNFNQIFEKVQSGEADYGLVPVENSLAGSVYDNYDLLFEHDINVVGEHYLKIDLHLLGIDSEMPHDIRLQHLSKVVSHYKALEQSEGFFQKHNWIHKEIYSDTAGAAKFVSDQKDPLLAAIASRQTADIYGLKIIKESVHDNPHNFTRFLIIGYKKNELKNSNKCSIIFTVLHLPGSLVMALKVLSDNKINLVKIESRPIHGKPFEYLFYVDFSWDHEQADKVHDILQELKQNTQTVKILGYYKSGAIANL
jgi:prephenate dehydratase